MQLQLKRGPVGSGSGRLQDAVEGVLLALRAVAPPTEPRVIRQERVRHQVHRLGAVGETLKQQLGFHEVKPTDGTA